MKMRSISHYNVKYSRSSDNASLYQSLHAKTLQNFSIVRYTNPHVLAEHTYSLLNHRRELKKNTCWRDRTMGTTRATCPINQKWQKRENYNMGGTYGYILCMTPAEEDSLLGIYFECHMSCFCLLRTFKYHPSLSI